MDWEIEDKFDRAHEERINNYCRSAFLDEHESKEKKGKSLLK